MPGERREQELLLIIDNFLRDDQMHCRGRRECTDAAACARAATGTDMTIMMLAVVRSGRRLDLCDLCIIVAVFARVAGNRQFRRDHRPLRSVDN